MFIETPVKMEISSVGAACEDGTYRTYGAWDFASKITINMTLLRSWDTCVETNATMAGYACENRKAGLHRACFFFVCEFK